MTQSLSRLLIYKIGFWGLIISDYRNRSRLSRQLTLWPNVSAATKRSRSWQALNLLSFVNSQGIATTCRETKKSIEEKKLFFSKNFFFESFFLKKKFGFTIRPQTAIAPEESWNTSGHRQLHFFCSCTSSGSAGDRSPRTAASALRPQFRKTGLRFCRSRFWKIEEIK